MNIPFFGRKKKPQTVMQKRHYQGGSVGRLLGGFFGTSTSADSALKPDLAKLRNRARDLERNNEYAARALELMEDGIVGDRGFTLQVKAVNRDGGLDLQGNQSVEMSWADWSKSASSCGTMTFHDLCMLAVRAQKRDGEFFAEIVRGRQYKHGISINPIESDRVDIDKNEVLPNGNEIRMGVERDSMKRPVAYWVLTYHPGDYDFQHKVREKKYQRIPAERMIHVFKPNRAGQSRGVTAFAPAIFAMKMLDGYRDAEITAARAAAAKFAVLVSPGGDGLADSFDGETPMLDYEAGTIQSLPSGFDLKMIDPTHPTTAFADFNKAVLRGIASGLGLSYESLSNDLEGTSYSSIRQGALLERDMFRKEQRFFIDHFVTKVYESWLNSAVEMGVTVPTLSSLDRFRMASQWRGRGFQWVDPLKEINAAVVGLNNGILSMQDVANHYGRDVEETFAQIARDKETAEQFGLDIAFEPFGATKAPVMPTGVSDESQADE